MSEAIQDGRSPIVPLFILDDNQIDPARNPYHSNAAVQFMCESLTDLDWTLRSEYSSRLLIMRGNPVGVLENILIALPFRAVYSNIDYTPYAKRRDSLIKDWCESSGIEFHQTEDSDLWRLDQVVRDDGEPWRVLNEYFRELSNEINKNKNLIRISSKIPKHIFLSSLPSSLPLIPAESLGSLYTPRTTVGQRGGRSEGLKRLGAQLEYVSDRPFPGIDGTSKLSAHLKFGTISPREVFARCGSLDHPVVRQLVMRSLCYRLYHSTPRLLLGESLQHSLDASIPWRSVDSGEWLAWTTGRTGLPFADAAIRQLIHEAWIHPRARMVTAVAACRYLLLDWRICEKFFASKLVDYDPILNSAGWGFGSGLGISDRRRVMSISDQGRRFDPECVYVKRWIPELAVVINEDIHNWSEERRIKYCGIDYPAPILNEADVLERSGKAWGPQSMSPS
jgi:deoxyribodipyrimidine photo-lyase